MFTNLLRLFMGMLFLSLLANAEVKEPTPNLEILNKGSDIWVKIKNGGVFIGENVTQATKVGGGVIRAGKKPEGKPQAFKAVDISKETNLYIYLTDPAKKAIPDKVYKFDAGKTIYITWNPAEKVPLYPQTGPQFSFNKTASGLSLSKNVIVTPKENNISDITLFVQSEENAKLLADKTAQTNIDTIPKVENISKVEADARLEASKLVEKQQDLDALWKNWCDPNDEPVHPTSLFCAAGMANSFALLILRLRFVVPEVQDKFDASSHALKLVGDNLPPLTGLDLKEVYNELLGNRAKTKKAINWKDFDAFIEFLNKSIAIAIYVNQAFMYPYGLSTKDFTTMPERKSQAQKLNADATKALQGWFSSAPEFPATSIVENKKYLKPSELFEKKCKGLGGGPWDGTLFCAIGAGNLSATYLAQISFVKPEFILPQVPNPNQPPAEAIHAISLVLNSVAPPGSWLATAIGFQIGPTVNKLNDKKGPAISWEDLRNTLITKLKDLTETVPHRGNSYMKPYGVQIAP